MKRKVLCKYCGRVNHIEEAKSSKTITEGECFKCFSLKEDISEAVMKVITKKLRLQFRKEDK